MGTIGVTDKAVLMWDPEWMAGNTPEQAAGLLIHECMHLMLGHMKRGKAAGRDPALDNKAGDLAINPGIVDMGFKLPDGARKGLFPEDFGWERGLTTDEYYELLRKLQEEGGGSGGGSAPGHIGAGACGSCAGNPNPNEPGNPNGGTDPQTAQALGQAERSPAELDRMVRQVAEDIRAEASRSRGTVPAGLQRWADEALKPAEVPWDQKLRRLARAALAWTAGASDHRYDMPSRRQAGIGYGPGKPVLPRLRQPKPKVGVIGDTSGSMGNAELAAVIRETNGVLKALGADVLFAACDSDVHGGVKKVKTATDLAKAMRGGGGTDMRPAFEEMMKSRPAPNIIICITDGQVGDGVPDKAPPGVKVIWVGVGPHQMRPAPWGEYLPIGKHTPQDEDEDDDDDDYP